MKSKLLLILITMLPLMANADNVMINGINYNLIPKGKIAEVISNPNKYRGSVSIPASVTYEGVAYSVISIGNSAFNQCWSLASVSIPNSVTSIGNYAFRECSGLTSITIPNSVTNIGENAFTGCNSLTKVIVSDIAAWCGISFSGYDANPLSKAHHLFSNESTEIIDLVIPNGVASIGSCAFRECGSLISVAIPESVTSIGEEAFQKCNGLEKVIVSDIAAWCGISFGDYYANPLCYAHHLYNDAEMEITDLAIPDGVTSISDYSFNNCSSLTSVTIPNNMTSIGDHAFANCLELANVYCYAEKVPSTSSDAYKNSLIEYATLHVPFKSIEQYKTQTPWSGFGTIVPFEGEIGEVFTIITAEGVMMTFKILTVREKTCQVGNGIESSINMASSGKITIPEMVNGYRVTAIGDKGFYNCTNMTSITIPSCVTSIGENAFYNCGSLKKVVVPDIAAWCGILFSGNEANPLTKANHLFFNESTEIKDLIIPNGVISIGSYAFRYCTGLTSVTIPNSVTSIGDFAFDGCSGLTSVTIPNSVTHIGNVALWGCSGLTSVTIPNSVTDIGSSAFENCTGLTSITIPSSVNQIGEYAFRHCIALKKVIVPDIAAWFDISFGDYTANPLSSAQHLFCDESTEIKDLVIPNGVNIKKFVLSGCSGLTSVTIPNGVTSIGEEAFTNCSGLTSITIPNSVTSIDRYAFKYCSGLASVTIPESVTSIGDATFWSCGLTDVYCHAENIPSTGSDIFYNSSIASATLHVPASSYNNYRATSPWKSFGSIVSFEYETILPQYISLLIPAKKELTAAQGGGPIDLIRSHIQLSSPYTEPSEGGLDALLDGDINTFWHSIWTSGGVAGGIHYLQADLINPVNEKVYVTFTRRPVANDHVTNMSVFGSNDPDASKAACEELLTFDCPYTSNTETITSPHFDTKGYRYLRFYANTTNRNLGIWHISEFQLYGDIPASDALANFMDGEDKRLQAIIDKQANLSSYQIGEAEYNELKEAYDAFMSKLAEIIDRIENVSEDNISNSSSTSMYNLQGSKLDKPQKGINIIRYSDGTSKKVLTK